MRKRLPAAFVVTVSAAAAATASVACHTEEPIHANPPPQEPQWNPPPPPSAVTDPADAGPTEDASTAVVNPVHWNPPPPRTLNATEAKTDEPILKTETGCEVDPGLDFHRGVGHRPKPRAVKCPAAMKDPAWGACLHATLTTTQAIDAEGGALCSCNNHGNPPRVISVACPSLP